MGEHGSCSDLIQLALWLGMKGGQPDLLDDVERLIRARLFPSQIVQPTEPRQHGAWGVYGHPYSRGCILDVFAAVLHVLTNVYLSAVTVANDGTVSVNLHFTLETPAASVRMQRTEVGRLSITPKREGPLRIRVPGWVPKATLQLSRGGRPLGLNWDGPYLRVPPETSAVSMPVHLEYEVPRRQSVEVMPVSHREFHLTWRGDDVVACDPTVPIYPTQPTSRAESQFK